MKRAFLMLSCLLWASSAFAQRDVIDLSQAVVHNSPLDVASWAKTTAIKTLVMQPESGHAPGLSFDFSAHATWPNYTPPGWDGPIQYTVWAGVKISGVWHVSGIIQMWREREATGAPILAYGPGCAVNNFACNWVYDSRWGAMAGYQPVAGEAMIFFLTAGNARGVGTVTSVRERSNVVMVNLPANDTGVYNFRTTTNTASDFDGDGKADHTVFRPSNGGWYTRWSSTLQLSGGQWGAAGDIPVAADYDADGKADMAVFRPSTGYWYVRFSQTGAGVAVLWGGVGDVPIPADYDGDGRADIAIFRPSTGIWYIAYSRTATGTSALWGGPGDIPIPGDYDGDNIADIGIFRPSNVTFYIRLSGSGQTYSYQWGLPTDVPVPGDYDGDYRTDLALYRPSTGMWYIGYTSTMQGAAIQWGGGADIPVPGDYDGDGRVDVAVFRPSTAIWYWRGGPGIQWGLLADFPILSR